MVDTNEYYISLKKDQNRLEAIDGHFEKWCKINEIWHFLAHLAEGPCELLKSLVVRRRLASVFCRPLTIFKKSSPL